MPALRRCRACKAPLPDAPIKRLHVCIGCGWEAAIGPQTDFVASPVYEVLYGGSVGGGKTDGIVMRQLRGVHQRGFGGVILRRTYPELEGKVIPKTLEWYPATGGVFNAGKSYWHWPATGARVHLGHVQHENDVHRYNGWEFQQIGPDELTSFTKYQYTYLLSRGRSPSGIPIQVGSTANPGGVGHEWVFERWAPWLNRSPNYTGPRAESGEVLWYRNTREGEIYLPRREPGALSRTFIRSRLEDNPHLLVNDPSYTDRLNGLDAVTRAQLLDGDWLAVPAAGKYYKRGWFGWCDCAPARVACRVRAWDLASTDDGGDWTIGVKMSLSYDGIFTVEDVVRVRERPAGVEKTILATAEADGKQVAIAIPQDPGQAGKAQVGAYAKLLCGYDIHSSRETGEKVVRQAPYSAQVEAGNVTLVRGAPWNEPYLQALEAFPSVGVHDDDIDASATAFTYLAEQLPDIEYWQALANIAKGRRA